MLAASRESSLIVVSFSPCPVNVFLVRLEIGALGGGVGIFFASTGAAPQDAHAMRRDSIGDSIEAHETPLEPWLPQEYNALISWCQIRFYSIILSRDRKWSRSFINHTYYSQNNQELTSSSQRKCRRNVLGCFGPTGGTQQHTTRNKKLLGAPGIATRSKDTTRGSWPHY